MVVYVVSKNNKKYKWLEIKHLLNFSTTAGIEVVWDVKTNKQKKANKIKSTLKNKLQISIDGMHHYLKNTSNQKDCASFEYKINVCMQADGFDIITVNVCSQ